MRITFVHHCLCGPQMNMVCGVKWQSEMKVWPCCMRVSVCETKLLSPSSVHSGAVRRRGLLSPHLTLSRWRVPTTARIAIWQPVWPWLEMATPLHTIPESEILNRRPGIFRYVDEEKPLPRLAIVEEER